MIFAIGIVLSSAASNAGQTSVMVRHIDDGSNSSAVILSYKADYSLTVDDGEFFVSNARITIDKASNRLLLTASADTDSIYDSATDALRGSQCNQIYSSILKGITNSIHSSVNGADPEYIGAYDSIESMKNVEFPIHNMALAWISEQKKLDNLILNISCEGSFN